MCTHTRVRTYVYVCTQSVAVLTWDHVYMLSLIIVTTMYHLPLYTFMYVCVVHIWICCPLAGVFVCTYVGMYVQYMHCITDVPAQCCCHFALECTTNVLECLVATLYSIWYP